MTIEMPDSSGQPDSPQAQRILESALTLLSQGGIGDMTVRAVALETGTSTRGIYTYFGGKQGLLDAIHNDGHARFRQAIQDAAKTGSDPVDALTRAFVAYRTWALDNPTHYVLMFASRSHGYQASAEVEHAAHASFLDLMALVAAVNDGTEQEVETWATRLWATAHGYVMLELSGPGRPHLDQGEVYAGGMRAVIATV